MIARSVRVVPVQPGKKRCILTDWTSKTTTDLTQIETWNQEDPAYNIGAVAKRDGQMILDCVAKGLLKRIAAETGQKLPETFRVLSGGTGCAHVYFSQTER